MLRTKVGAGIAVAAALAFGAGPALAASGWTIVSIPPRKRNSGSFNPLAMQTAG